MATRLAAIAAARMTGSTAVYRVGGQWMHTRKTLVALQRGYKWIIRDYVPLSQVDRPPPE